MGAHLSRPHPVDEGVAFPTAAVGRGEGGGLGAVVGGTHGNLLLGADAGEDLGLVLLTRFLHAHDEEAPQGAEHEMVHQDLSDDEGAVPPGKCDAKFPAQVAARTSAMGVQKGTCNKMNPQRIRARNANVVAQ